MAKQYADLTTKCFVNLISLEDLGSKPQSFQCSERLLFLQECT